MLSKFYIFILLVTVFLFKITSTPRALVLPPNAFQIAFENVSSTDLTIEKSDEASFFRLKDTEGGRVLKIYSYGIFEDTSSNQKTPVTLKSSSDKIMLCTDINNNKTCSDNVYIPGPTFRGVEIRPEFTKDTLIAEKLFLDAYRSKRTPGEFDLILDENGYSQYKKYSAFIIDGDKKEMEKFQLVGEIDNKNFTVTGTIYYEPNVLTLSQKKENEINNAKTEKILEIISKVSLIVSVLFLIFSLSQLINKLFRKKKVTWLAIATSFSASLFFYLIYFFLNAFINIELLM